MMAPEECLKLLEKLLSKLNISLSISTTGEHKAAVLDVLKQLIDSKGWASGRDVKTLSRPSLNLFLRKRVRLKRSLDQKDFVYPIKSSWTAWRQY
jgi:hypothetical protein